MRRRKDLSVRRRRWIPPKLPWPRRNSTLEAAPADNERVQALENYTTVTAPIAGVVIWRYADTGALIQGGTNSNDQALPIVRLSQSSLLRLRVPVPEDDVQYVHEGDSLAGARGCHQPLLHGQDRALHAQCEL